MKFKTDITSDDINDLMKDWITTRDGNFIHCTTDDRLNWEKEEYAEEGYSSFMLDPKTPEIDILKEAKGIANDMLIAMDLPHRVSVRLTKSGSYCNPNDVFVQTDMFDVPRQKIGKKLDAFLGAAIHEGCHILYTDFSEMSKDSTVHLLTNLLEDERIEEKLGDEKPGYSHFIEAVKEHVFGKYQKSEIELSDKIRLINCLIKIIRFPRFLDKTEIEEFAPCLIEIKKILFPYPNSTKECQDKAIEIKKIIEEFFAHIDKPKSPEKEKSESGKSDISGTDDSASHIDDDDAENETPAEENDSETETDDSSGSGLDDEETNSEMDSSGYETKSDDLSFESDKTDGDSDDMSSGFDDSDELSDEERKKYDSIIDEIMKSIESELYGDSDSICERLEDATETDIKYLDGEVEFGTNRKTLFTYESPNRLIYEESYDRIRRYIPSMSKLLLAQSTEYTLTYRGMRSGILDTNKLAEAYQGVETIYMRQGHVKSNKIAVCVLIDESGSMSGKRIIAARDAAILINEAFGKLPNIELYVYGHSGDIAFNGATELYVYRENKSFKKFALGSVKARSQNRDGIAIYETAKRVRQFTKLPVIMFILSDGAPCASKYSGLSAICDTRDNVKKVENLGFGVIQICINHVYNPSDMFTNYVILNDMNTLSHELSKIIKSTALKMTKNFISF